MSRVDLKYGAREVEKMGLRAKRAVAKGLWSAAIRGVQVIQTQLIARATPSPVDRGLYRGGWRHGPLHEGGELVGGELWNPEHHAAIIERGARASNVKIGRAMIDALEEWVRRKHVGDPEAARSTAWAIATDMKRRGIFGPKGLRILEDLMVRLMPGIAAEEIRREFRAASERE